MSNDIELAASICTFNNGICCNDNCFSLDVSCFVTPLESTGEDASSNLSSYPAIFPSNFSHILWGRCLSTLTTWRERWWLTTTKMTVGRLMTLSSMLVDYDSNHFLHWSVVNSSTGCSLHCKACECFWQLPERHVSVYFIPLVADTSFTPESFGLLRPLSCTTSFVLYDWNNHMRWKL